MARSPAAANGGWPGPRHPAEPDPRFARPAPQGQRPAQPAGYPQQGAGYPQQGGYPEHQQGAQGYDPQSAYHYPQNGQAAPAQPNPRQGLSSLDPAGRGAAEYAPFPTSPFGQQQQPGYGQQAQQPGYGYPQQQPAASNGYRPAPPPYAAPSRQPEPAPEPRSAAPGFEQWPGTAPTQDQHGGYDLGNFLPASAPQPGGMPLQPDPAGHLEPEWGPGAQLGYGEVGAMHDPYVGGGQMGYEPVHGGALEQAYHEEGVDYDVEEPRRSSWVLRIAGAIVVAIGLGYGLAQGYKLVAGSTPDGGIPPVVRGDAAPSKTLPADPGGKQFAHADAKIMGRLGEGSPSSSAAAAADTDVDANGARKVQTLVVGRDGSITPPSAPASEEPVTTGAVAVPGLTVIDGYGGNYPQASPTAAPAAQEETSKPEPATASSPVVIKPPAADEPKPVKVARVVPTRSAAPAAPPKAPAAPKKTAAITPPSTSSGANGYVVVLASIPASSDSRLSALRKFADMQQKYGAVLQNKTPDVQEANLGARGTYHRLLVGPPGSRAQANTLCNNLKTAGYKDCWVMAY